MFNPIVDDMLMHYGMPRRSGRYPWGSGKNPYQRTGDFISRVEELKAEGFTFTDADGKTYTGEVAIAKSMGLTTTQLRTQLSLAKAERRADNVATAKALREKGYSLNEIAQQMGYANDSSVRSLLNTDSEARMNQAQATADILKKMVDEHGMLDVGAGVERELGVSEEKLREALYILELEGYNTFSGGIPQVTNPGKQTTMKVLCPPDTLYKVDDNGKKTTSAIYDYENIHTVTDYVSHDGGATYDPKWVYPESLDSSRLSIRYGDEGGAERDGLIEIRRGVDDLSLGNSHYAQVRILVDGTHYIKGMAVYADDLPEGVDIRFNTNKKSGTPVTSSDPKGKQVLKPIKDDPTNPFGSAIKAGINDIDNDSYKGGQSYYIDKDGNKKLSLINKRSDEGDWANWSNKLPSQFLSKQSKALVTKQLNLTVADKMMEYDEICSLTNPTVKRLLLKTFADDCDSAAVHLQAASLPRQKYQVILPITSLKDTEVYAPNYNNGETVALVRFPHGGTFEIPVLTVNNKNKEARSTIGTTAKDAVGINSKIAGILSGADFDGDTVLVIPCNSKKSKVKIQTKNPLEGLKDFDPKLEYGGKKEGTFKVMKDTQKQMGVISNLITDMTLKGATDEELSRAVRHSMVVIDAEKHKLDYKQSEKDNGISALKKKYQGHVDADGKYHEGASTIISKAKSETSVLKRQGSPTIDENTGELKYKTATNLTYTDKRTGKTVTRTQRSTKMAETNDAYTLVSDMDNPVESAYANYANKMKSMANQARLEYLATPKLKYDSEANKKYASEVKSLNTQLSAAKMNAPREREAQRIANTLVGAKKESNPSMTKAEIKKASQQAIVEARTSVGAERSPIVISDKEWTAIQAGAISDNNLTEILTYTDTDSLRQRATPRQTTSLSQAQISKIHAMEMSGYTISEIAKAIGKSSSTVANYIN